MSSDAPPFQGPQAEVGENRPPEHSQHHNSFHQQNFNQLSYQHQAPQNQNSQSQFPPAQDESKGANNASTASLGKTQTVFIHKLYDMLEDSSLSHLIWWSPTNDSFCLYPGEEFSNVLAQYFKHTNIASFIRQLNMYGFRSTTASTRMRKTPREITRAQARARLAGSSATPQTSSERATLSRCA